MVEFYVEPNTTTIPLGRQGENLARTIYFELSELISNYGEGTATLVCLRPSDTAPYVCSVTRNGIMLSWSPTDTDTAFAGAGKCELRWVVGDVLAKSIVYNTTISASITGAEEMPDRYQSWYEQLFAQIQVYTIATQRIDALNARVDSFIALEDGSTTGDAELIDARIGYDGTVHASLGTAIREQIRELHETGGGVQGIGVDTIVALTQEEYDAIQNKSETTLYIITDGSGGGGGLPYYTVRNELTNISTNNSATSVLHGNVYTATLTPDENYFIDTVSVKMGGVDITASAYSNGVINIPSVTGNIVITAVGDTDLVTYPYLQSDGTAFITLDEAVDTRDIVIEVATAYVDKTTNTNRYAILGASISTFFSFEDTKWANFSLLGVRAAYKETDRTTRHVYKATPTALYRDGVSVVTRNAGTKTGAEKISVFKSTQSTNVNAYVKIYNIKIYHGETLVADYTPVEHEGAPCLYDSVGDKYAYNSAGSGTLIYGTELGE